MSTANGNHHFNSHIQRVGEYAHYVGQDIPTKLREVLPFLEEMVRFGLGAEDFCVYVPYNTAERTRMVARNEFKGTDLDAHITAASQNPARTVVLIHESMDASVCIKTITLDLNGPSSTDTHHQERVRQRILACEKMNNIVMDKALPLKHKRRQRENRIMIV